jgi:rod shape-determining protein MreD
VIVAPAAFLRVGLILLFAVVIQLSGFGDVRVLGAQPNLVPLAVAAVALYGGSVSGAATGFAAGLLLDLAVGQELGSSSLVLTPVGYAVGRYREIRDPAHELTAIPVAVAATIGYSAAFAAVSFMLEIGATVNAVVFRDMVATAILNAIVALPVFSICRRLLRPSLRVDPTAHRKRRKSPRESGPLGLRGLEV